MGAGIKMVANNKKAYHDYFIDDKFEAGIELFGTEVKSIRMGKCSIKEAFIKIESDGQVYVFGISAHMRREISLIKIRCVCGNSFSTNWRSAA